MCNYRGNTTVGLFLYDKDRLRNSYKHTIEVIKKFKAIKDGKPKVYFIINETNNEVIYIGSCKIDIHQRLYCHIKDSYDLVMGYLHDGKARKINNDYKKARKFCDSIYNLDVLSVLVFGEYNTLRDAELVEKSLIFHVSNFKMNFDISNTSGVKKLSIKPIKKHI
jgi:hypothetical protein